MNPLFKILLNPCLPPKSPRKIPQKMHPTHPKKNTRSQKKAGAVLGRLLLLTVDYNVKKIKVVVYTVQHTFQKKLPVNRI